MKKTITVLLLFATILACLAGCGSASSKGDIPESDYPKIETAVAERVSPILEQYGCTYSDVDLQVRESEDSEFMIYNAVVTVPELSSLSVKWKAHLAGQINAITSADIEGDIGEEYPSRSVISVKVSGDSGELLFVEVEGQVTLIEGDTALVLNQSWEEIDSSDETANK